MVIFVMLGHAESMKLCLLLVYSVHKS